MKNFHSKSNYFINFLTTKQKWWGLLTVFGFLLFSVHLQAQTTSVSATYIAGDIFTNYTNNNNIYDPNCVGTLNITVPTGGDWEVQGFDVSYTMTAAAGGWMLDQRSRIYCQNTTTAEAASVGVGNNIGTMSYARTGVAIANGTYTGGSMLTFEMQAFRTYTGLDPFGVRLFPDCDLNENWVDNNTWTITVYFVSAPCTPSVTIASNDADNSINVGTSVTFTATPTNGGSAPTYQWKKNGSPVGTNAATYTDATLADNDAITVEMTSNEACASPTMATSNGITMTVAVTPTLISGTITPACDNDGGIVVAIAPTATLSAVRYVRIQQNQNEPINLAEVLAIEALTGTNVALNKTVTAQSTYPGYPNSNLVDGNSNTFGHSDAAGTNEFFEIDLGGTYLLDKIQIINRLDCCQFRANNLLLIFKDASGNTLYSQQINAEGQAASAYTTDWNVTDVTWADAATTLNRTNLAAGDYTLNYADVNGVSSSQIFTVPVSTISVVPTVTIVSNDADNSITTGTSVTFTATPTNGGNTPTYQWKKNGTNVGTNSATYTDASLADSDSIWVEMTSSNPCAAVAATISNVITTTVVQHYTATVSDVCGGPNNGAIDINVTAPQFPTAVRYVRIKQNQVMLLNLAELRVIQAGTGVNLALNKPVTTQINHCCIPIGHLVDGNISTFGHGGESPSPNEAFEVDLGAEYFLERIEIVNRQNCCQERSSNLQLILKNAAGTVVGSRQIDAYQNQNSAFQTDWYWSFGSWADADSVSFDRTNLPAGTYTFQYSDMSGYTETQTFNIANNNVTPSVTIASDDADNSISTGTSVTFTATPTNGGSAPTYQWKKNGSPVGTNAATYTDATLADNDAITVEMTSNEACASPTMATSNAITMTVIDPCAAFGTRIYVTENGTGDGSSWTNATSNLQAAIDNTCGIAEVWVAAGTYTPTTTTDRTISFVMKNGVAIYGGFAGTETALSSRNSTTNQTILSGNIGNLNDDSDNSHHVISNSGLNNTAVLDGFIVTGGKANGGGSLGWGGGIYNNNASPTFTNIIVAENSASAGGGIYNYNASPTLTNVTVSWNTALYDGGGIYTTETSPTFTNVIVSGNTANNAGGGIYILGDGASQNTTFVNCLFVNNSSNTGGGAIAYDDLPAPYTVELINCTFYGNTDASGGGVFYTDYWDTGLIPPRFENCILWGNSSSVNTLGSFVFENSLLQNASCPSNGTCTNSLFNQDPLFTDVANGDFTLQFCSPSVGKGDNAAVASVATDLAGNTRIQQTTVDMGAYESTFSYNVVVPSVAISTPNNSISTGTSVTFTATPTNGGSAPTYQWKKNGNPVGTNAATYTDATLANNDAITVEMTSNDACASPTMATSNGITMTVTTDPCAAFGTRIYVTENGTGDGSSWTNATSNLQAAIDNTCGIAEVWVAAGTYMPTTTTDRTISFVMKNGVAIYGGFAGTETALSSRNWTNNPTILSGDIGNLNDDYDNSHHVIANDNNGLDNTAVLDGFTVTGGKAEGNYPLNLGGGIYNLSVSPIFTNITVSGNSADDGGGIYNDEASPTFTNVTVSGNTAYGGGGIYNYLTSPTFTNLTISGNTADNGGGIYDYIASPTFTNVTVSGNSSDYGGGIYIFGENASQNTTFVNCLFVNNSANNGGGAIVYDDMPAPYTVELINCTFYDNTDASGGGAFYTAFWDTDKIPPRFENCILWGNSSSVNAMDEAGTPVSFVFENTLLQDASCPSNGTCTNSLFNQDPLFVSTTDFALQAASPAINAGSDALWTATGLTTDLAGNTRPFGVVDMGAYENQTVLPVEMLYFTGEATENGNLLTWATATEENNAGFEVQKSMDARTFEKIGFVVGNGTTYEQQTYEFLDKNTTNGVTYYRLKQLDFDGKFDYSNIVSISNNNAAIAEMLLYPNPVKDFLTIENGEGTATIFNALGQPLRQFNITDTKYFLDTNDLPQGIYTLQVRRTDGTAVIKQFIK